MMLIINWFRQANLISKKRFFLFFTVIALSSFSQDSLYFRAKAYLNYNRFDSAYYFINAALKKNSNDIHYWLLKGDILFGRKNWDGAINAYKVVAKKKPALVNYQLAQCYAKTKKFEKAKQYLEAYLNQRNRTESYKIKLDTCFRQFAETDMWKSLWATESDNNYQKFLSEIEYNIRYEHYTEALEQIDNYLVNHPKKYYVYFLKGKILEILHDNNAALTAYENAYRLKSKDYKIAKTYGELLFKLKKFKKARTVFVQLNTYDKYDILPLYLIGKCDFALKKYKRALTELRSFTKYYFKHPESHFYLAKTYWAQKEYFNALKAINVAVEANPNNFDYLLTRGEIYLESQAYKLAKKDFLLAMDISTKDAGRLFFLIGICYQHLGDPGMACAYWKRAYEHQYMEADDYRMKYCQ